MESGITHRYERGLTLALLVGVVDTVYLTWRFTALFAGWVTPGTGLCSWTALIDCDQVLRTPEARAFVVPNAVLAVGFFTGTFAWWIVGRRLTEHRKIIVDLLTFWLALASLITLYFWWLMFHIKWLCPFCPWNHVFTYIAFYYAARLRGVTEAQVTKPPLAPLVRLVAVCVAWFWLCQIAWFVAEWTVLKR